MRPIFKKVTIEMTDKNLLSNVILLDKSNIDKYEELRSQDYTIQCANELVSMFRDRGKGTFMFVLTHLNRFTDQDIIMIIRDFTSDMKYFRITDEELISIFLEKVYEEHGEILINMKADIEKGADIFLNTNGGFTPLYSNQYRIISTDVIESHLFNSIFLKYSFVKDDYQTSFIYCNKQVYFLESKLGCVATHEDIIKYYDLLPNKSCRLVYKIYDLDFALGGIEGLAPSYVYDFDESGERLINNLKKQDLDTIEKFCSSINIS